MVSEHPNDYEIPFDCQRLDTKSRSSASVATDSIRQTTLLTAQYVLSHSPIAYCITEGHHICRNNYVCSLYFMTTVITTAGFGDVYPRTILEMTLVAIMMLTGKFIVAIFIGDMSAIVQNYWYTLGIFEYYMMILKVQSEMYLCKVTSCLPRSEL